MKKTKLTRSLLAACSIVALTAVMYGCAHGGGDDEPAATDMTDPPEPAPPTELEIAQAAQAAAEAAQAAAEAAQAAAEAAQAAAEAEVTELQTQLDTATGNATELQTQLDTATGNATELQTQLDTATGNATELQTQLDTATGNATELQTQLDAANADVTRLTGELDTANADVTRLTGELDTANADVTRLQDDVTRLQDELTNATVDPDPEATKAAETKRTAIGVEAAQTDDDGLGGDGATPTVGQIAGEYNLAIEYGSTTITVETSADADDNEMFTDAMMGLDRGRTMLVREMDPDMMTGDIVREIAIVGTDIEAPVATAFAMWENADGGTPQALDARDLDATMDGPDMDGVNTNDFTALDVEVSEAVRALIGLPSLVTGGTVTHNYDNDDSNTDDMDEAGEVAGTYNGAMGTYRCNGTGECSITLDADGAVTATTGTWVFTPDTGATSMQEDYDYMHYGFWLQQTEDSDGAITYNEIQTFAGSSVAATGSVAQVTGSASYSGDAVGVYVKDGTRTIPTATSGHFTADVALTAYFGQTVDDTDTDDVDEAGQIPPSLLNTLSGSISNFELSRGEENGWGVNLQGDIDTSEGTVTSAAGATGGGAPAAWSATFHGPTADDTQPHSVVGEFNANFSNGAVAGAFGARQ